MSVTQTLSGLNDAVSGRYEPPDVQVAAGPGFVVEMVNLAERVWRTDGGPAQVVLTRDLSEFYGTGDDLLTDPRIIYDAPSGRWLASISNVERDSVLLAVSAGRDPTGAWTVTSYASPGCADQPRLGVADGVVVLAADIFSGCETRGATILGNEMWIVNKEQLLAGSTTPAFTTSGPSLQYESLAPVQSLSSTATEYVVGVDDRASRVVRLLTVDGIPPAPVRVSEVAAPSIAPLLQPPPAAQPLSGTGRRPPITTNDNRILDSVWENGRLWFSANGRCVPVGDSLIRSCARIVELSTATSTVSWDTDLAFPGAHIFFAAIRPDGSGNLVVVAGESGLNVRPELVVVARTPDGAFTAPVVVAQSVGTYLGDRYGDYFGAARDPLDPSIVWVAGEAGTDVPKGRGWSTSVASVVVGAPGPLPVAAGTGPPGIQAVSAVVRTGGALRLAYRALDDGVSVHAIVTVERQKTVVFRATTPAAALHANQRYFVLWPASTKLRGTFRFCVTAVSESGLRSPRSCASFILR